MLISAEIISNKLTNTSNMRFMELLGLLGNMFALSLYNYVDPHAPAGFLAGDASFTLQPFRAVTSGNRTVFKFGDEYNRK